MPRVPLRPLWAALVVLSSFPTVVRAQTTTPATPATPAVPPSETAANPGTVAPAPKKEAPPAAGEKGFFIRSSDGAYQVRVRGLLQVDGRSFSGDTKPQLTDGFEIRRARPIIEGTAFRILDFRLMPDFGEGKAVLFDAYGELKAQPWLKLKVGKFKPPVGFERLQSAASTFFIERGFPTALVPNRDVGVQLGGDLSTGAVTYAVGVFNGVPDGGNGDLDTNESKDVAGRLYLRPFRFFGNEALKNVGVGIAGTGGRQSGSATAPNLPSFKSPGQQTFFSFASDAYAHGFRWSVAPQLAAWVDRFGLLAEYVLVDERVTKGTNHGELRNRAWQVAGSVVLTGEKASEDGVTAAHPFTGDGGGWGAFEVVARYQEFHVDKSAFPLFADPAKSARQARGYGVGVNWWANLNLRVSLDYDRTSFVGGAADGGDRQPENALFGRFQVAF